MLFYVKEPLNNPQFRYHKEIHLKQCNDDREKAHECSGKNHRLCEDTWSSKHVCLEMANHISLVLTKEIAWYTTNQLYRIRHHKGKNAKNLSDLFLSGGNICIYFLFPQSWAMMSPSCCASPFINILICIK